MLCLNLAGAGGFEPPTTGFGVYCFPCCSVRLGTALEHPVGNPKPHLCLVYHSVTSHPTESVTNP